MLLHSSQRHLRSLHSLTLWLEPSSSQPSAGCPQVRCQVGIDGCIWRPRFPPEYYTTGAGCQDALIRRSVVNIWYKRASQYPLSPSTHCAQTYRNSYISSLTEIPHISHSLVICPSIAWQKWAHEWKRWNIYMWRNISFVVHWLRQTQKNLAAREFYRGIDTFSPDRWGEKLLGKYSHIESLFRWKSIFRWNCSDSMPKMIDVEVIQE